MGAPRQKEKIVYMVKSSKPSKKYMVGVVDLTTGALRVIHFGDSNYEQYKDRTRLELYKDKNHYDKNRQMTSERLDIAME